MLNVLVIGDIVGRPGREIVSRQLGDLRKKEDISFVVANGENASGGSGITPKEAEELFGAGVDVITCGDHVWSKREVIPYITSEPRLLRPANYPPSNPGSGHGIFRTGEGHKIGVIHLAGRVFMNQHSSCPFEVGKNILDKMLEETKIIIVDIHAEATSEKIALGWYLDGLVSFVFGTHTHVPTADERILPKGTAYITDVGMTGPYESVLGRKVDRVLYKFLTQMPSQFDVAENDVRLYCAISSIYYDSGKANSIKRLVVT